jgi:anti-sigma regulatory factor (Ser/Thr protein kinase)
MVELNPAAVDCELRAFEPVPISAHAARTFVTEFLRRHGATETVIGDYALAVSELATNIIEHGGGSDVTIRVDVTDPRWWEVEVIGGTSVPPDEVLHPETWAVASAEEISGRGLGIVRHLMHDVIADTTDGRVSIRCRQRRAEAT